MKKQNKIPRTYRLPEKTIEQIQEIKESFLTDGLEISSDAAVVSYAVSAARGLCKQVDDGDIPMYLKKEEVEMLLSWFKTSTQESSLQFQESLKLKDKLNWYIETSP